QPRPGAVKPGDGGLYTARQLAVLVRRIQAQPFLDLSQRQNAVEVAFNNPRPHLRHHGKTSDSSARGKHVSAVSREQLMTSTPARCRSGSVSANLSAHFFREPAFGLLRRPVW